jgi:hypothetical protein
MSTMGDLDPIETEEWVDALRAVQQRRGGERSNSRPHGCRRISEICLAIEMGCQPSDIGQTIHPHPTLRESIGMAAELFEGHWTDLPPQKKR